MVSYHHQLNGHEIEQTLGDSGGQKSMHSMGLQRIRHNLATQQQKRTQEFGGVFMQGVSYNTEEGI